MGKISWLKSKGYRYYVLYPTTEENVFTIQSIVKTKRTAEKNSHLKGKVYFCDFSDTKYTVHVGDKVQLSLSSFVPITEII
jgi:hypothetical protein